MIPFGQALPRGSAGIGEIVVYQWSIDGIGADEAWRVVVEVEPAVLSPSSFEIEGRGSKSDLARFEATAPGDAQVRFTAYCGADVQIGQPLIRVTSEA